ncbi:hypothetical protein LCGC14_1652790 [marine sediment metagenome]|uniref:Uncharacterized protein n=1 Tax=marine sediment metagenome TaxID=412755 RepID=A0A0F9IIV6_9ZZZZ
MTRNKALKDALAKHLGIDSVDVLQGKGGFWVKGQGFWTIAKARRVTGIKATPRPRRERITAYGDYATIAAIGGRLNG